MPEVTASAIVAMCCGNSSKVVPPYLIIFATRQPGGCLSFSCFLNLIDSWTTVAVWKPLGGYTAHVALGDIMGRKGLCSMSR